MNMKWANNCRIAVAKAIGKLIEMLSTPPKEQFSFTKGDIRVLWTKLMSLVRGNLPARQNKSGQLASKFIGSNGSLKIVKEKSLSPKSAPNSLASSTRSSCQMSLITHSMPTRKRAQTNIKQNLKPPININAYQSHVTHF